MIVWTLVILILGIISYVSLATWGSPPAANLTFAKAANIGVMLVALGISYRSWWEKRNGEIGKLKKRIEELERKIKELTAAKS